MPDIKSVKPMKNYIVEVVLNNGSTILLNMANKLNTSRFCLLQDEELFNKVTTDGDVIHWTNLIEISADEVCDIAKSNLGRVKL